MARKKEMSKEKAKAIAIGACLGTLVLMLLVGWLLS